MLERCKSTKDLVEYYRDTFDLFSKSLTEAKILKDLEVASGAKEQLIYYKEILRREIGDLAGEARFYLGKKFGFLEVNHFGEGLAAARKSGEGYFYINPKGKIVISGPFDEAGVFKNGKARVCFKGDCWHIDTNGQRLGIKFKRFTKE